MKGRKHIDALTVLSMQFERGSFPHRVLTEAAGFIIQAQKMRGDQAVTPEKSADISERWLADVIAMLHYVAGDLSEDNRLMALAAQSLIVSAPRVTPVEEQS